MIWIILIVAIFIIAGLSKSSEEKKAVELLVSMYNAGKITKAEFQAALDYMEKN